MYGDNTTGHHTLWLNPLLLPRPACGRSEKDKGLLLIIKKHTNFKKVIASFERVC